MIGTKWRHNKRNSEYFVAGLVNSREVFNDGGMAHLVVSCYQTGHIHFTLTKQVEVGMRAALLIPVNVQNSTLTGENFDSWVIYQSIADHLFYVRPKPEFLDGRFTQLTHCA